MDASSYPLSSALRFNPRRTNAHTSSGGLQRIFDDMCNMSENQLLCCLSKFQGVSPENKSKIRSFGGYFVGIMKNYREGGRDHVIDPRTGEMTGNPVGSRRVLEQQQAQVSERTLLACQRRYRF